jgi:hypothetical protein
MDPSRPPLACDMIYAVDIVYENLEWHTNRRELENPDRAHSMCNRGDFGAIRVHSLDVPSAITLNSPCIRRPRKLLAQAE